MATISTEQTYFSFDDFTNKCLFDVIHISYFNNIYLFTLTMVIYKDITRIFRLIYHV